MDSTKQHRNEMRLLSLCSGYGGIEKGIELSGVKVRAVAYVEIEAFAVANLVAAMEKGFMDAAPIWTNLKTFDPKPFFGLVDIFTAGYPCQPFSHSGKRKGSEDPRHLWPYILGHIEAIRPIYCFFENVEGHLTLGFDEVYRSLSDLGYSVEAGIFSSEETGGTHQRKRLFILAKLADSNCSYGRRKPGGIPSNKAKKRIQEQYQDSKLIESSEMDNTYCNDAGGKIRGINAKKNRIQKVDRKENSTTRNPSGASQSKELANRNGKRLQRERSYNGEEKWNEQKRPVTQCSRIPIARPGQEQYEWEQPRQNTKDELKSALGLSIADGYDFRTDFLRSLGNGVDPCTAKKAFETLMDKF